MMTGELLYKRYLFEVWAYAWLGVRATHGFSAGKVWFEAKIVDMQKHANQGLRVGWSTNDSDWFVGQCATS